MPYHVTMLYAALLGILLVILSWGVSKVRLRERVSLGAGEVSDLESAIRAHGNFIEYVPFALILLILAESAVAHSWLLHTLGGSLLAGRLLHARTCASARGPMARFTCSTSMTESSVCWFPTGQGDGEQLGF